MLPDKPYQNIKSSGFGCWVSPYLALYGVAFSGLAASITLLVASITILVLVLVSPEWKDIPVIDLIYAKITNVSDTLVNYKIINNTINTEENKKALFYGLDAVYIIISILVLIYFILLVMKILTKDQDGVTSLIKFASIVCAVCRILFCLQYGINVILFFGEFKKNDPLLFWFFMGIYAIIAILDVIMGSLVIQGVRKNKIGLVKLFIIYMIGMFVLRLGLCCVFIFAYENNVIDLLVHILTFSGSYSFFVLYYTWMVHDHDSLHDQTDEDVEEGDDDCDTSSIIYSSIRGQGESVRLPRISIRGEGAPILNIHASVTSWLKVAGSRHWALIFEGTLYMYNTQHDLFPVRKLKLNGNTRTTRKAHIYLQVNSEKLKLLVLVDEEHKIDKKMREWNEALDQASNKNI